VKITYTKSAEKEILSLDKSTGQRIFKKIELLEKNPFGQGAKKLGGGKGYRMRVGDYRVIYIIDKENKEVVIIKIRHRKEAYR